MTTLKYLVIYLLTMNSSFASNSDELVDALVSDLSSSISEITSPIEVSHYTNRKSLGITSEVILNSKDPLIEKHLNDWSSWFLNAAHVQESHDRQGLYVAFDPLSSRSFGDSEGDNGQWDNVSDYVLFQFQIPKGFKFLDTRKKEIFSKYDTKIQSEFSEKIANLFIQAGCNIGSYGALFRRAYGKTCNDILLKVLIRLSVDGIVYPWNSAGFLGCESRPRAAMILLNANKISHSSVEIYSSHDSDNSSVHIEKRKILQALFENEVQNKAWSEFEESLFIPTRNKYPNALSNSPADYTSTLSWIKQNLAGCKSDSNEIPTLNLE